MTRRGSRSGARSPSLDRASAAPAAIDWKSHPIAVAAASCAATILLCIAVVTQWVVPTQTAKLELELYKVKERQRHTVTALNTKVAESRKLQAELSLAKKDIKSLEGDLLVARTTNLLAPGSPYPNGLEKVRIGMPLESVYDVFPHDWIEKDEDDPDILVVKVSNSPISRVSYQADLRDKRRAIRGIAYYMDYMLGWPEDFLHNRLVLALGEPVEQPRPNYYRWVHHSSDGVFQLSEGSFSIVAKNYSPSTWPH